MWKKSGKSLLERECDNRIPGTLYIYVRLKHLSFPDAEVQFHRFSSFRLYVITP